MPYTKNVQECFCLNSEKVYRLSWVPLFVPRHCAFVLTPCLVKLCCLILPVSTIVLARGTSTYSRYVRRVTFLIMQTISFNLLHDISWALFDFRASFRSTCELSADSWSSSLTHFSKTVAVAMNISKSFEIIWHKALLLNSLPSHSLYSLPLVSFLTLQLL